MTPHRGWQQPAEHGTGTFRRDSDGDSYRAIYARWPAGEFGLVTVTVEQFAKYPPEARAERLAEGLRDGWVQAEYLVTTDAGRTARFAAVAGRWMAAGAATYARMGDAAAAALADLG